MLPRRLYFSALINVALLFLGPVVSAEAVHTLVLDGMGKGAAPLDGPWQFRLGDDPAWANPA
jgi:hypothetical protein